MGRIQAGAHVEPIGRALQLLPSGIRARLRGVRWVVGVDPVFVGLHHFEDTDDGRSYRGTAHCAFPFHLARGWDWTPTVVLPVPMTVETVIHELGHALHWETGLDDHGFAPVTTYALTNHREAYAEAFTAWAMPEAYPWAREILDRDKRARAHFDQLTE